MKTAKQHPEDTSRSSAYEEMLSEALAQPSVSELLEVFQTWKSSNEEEPAFRDAMNLPSTCSTANTSF